MNNVLGIKAYMTSHVRLIMTRICLSMTLAWPILHTARSLSLVALLI